jgi:hypothetical protein
LAHWFVYRNRDNIPTSGRNEIWRVEILLMRNEMKIRVPVKRLHVALLLLLVAAPLLRAQAPARLLGTITAINGDTISVKADADGDHQVQVPATAAIKRIAPGQKDLSAAETMPYNDLATGDRVLVKLDADAPGPISQALQIIAVKQADVVLKQEKDREDWQRRGVGGLVKSVDSASGVIVLSSGSGTTAKTITVHTTRTTLLKRYAPASVRFDTAQTAPIDAIHVGDQLRARGTKNAEGTEIAAEEAISGSFRNISGMIVSLDAAGSTLVVKDLATKKQITIHITGEAQMRRLPEMMARMMAARLKTTTGGPSGAKTPQSPASSGAAHYGGAQGNGGSGDPQQMLNRAPAIQLADLKKGDAVMVVSTDGTTEVTAISLLAGVEPLLEAPAAQNLLSNWSMGSSAAEAAQ